MEEDESLVTETDDRVYLDVKGLLERLQVREPGVDLGGVRGLLWLEAAARCSGVNGCKTVDDRELGELLDLVRDMAGISRQGAEDGVSYIPLLCNYIFKLSSSRLLTTDRPVTLTPVS